MTLSRRRLVKVLLTLAALALLAAPAALALAQGWIAVTFTPSGEEPAPDPTPIEAWVALSLVYVAWAPLVVVGLVFALDRLGYRFTPAERDQRPTRKQRRRQTAGLKYLQSHQSPPRRKGGR